MPPAGSQRTSSAADLADRCEVQLAYAIGIAQPVSVRCFTFGTGKIGEEQLTEVVRQVFDLRAGRIVEQLDLKRAQFRATAAYGHFGREDAGFHWERSRPGRGREVGGPGPTPEFADQRLCRISAGVAGKKCAPTAFPRTRMGTSGDGFHFPARILQPGPPDPDCVPMGVAAPTPLDPSRSEEPHGREPGNLLLRDM